MTIASPPPADHTPVSIEAEQALLSALIVNNDAYGLVASSVSAEHFSEPLHARLFIEIGRQIGNGQRVSAVTLKDSFPDEKLAPDLTVLQYLIQLQLNCTSVLLAKEYANTIRNLAVMREVIAIGEDLRRARLNCTGPDEAMERAWCALDTLRVQAAGASGGRASMAEIIRQIREQRAEGNHRGAIVSTGFADLDRPLGGGWRARRLYVLAGRPGMGKTVFMLSSLRRVARQKTFVLIFSLEIDRDEVRSRLTADELARTTSPMNYGSILNGEFSSYDLSKVEQAEDSLAQLPIEIDDAGGVSMVDIEAKSRIARDRFAKSGYELGVIGIDYLGLIRTSGRYRGNKVDEFGEIALSAKTLAKRLDVPVVLLAQLNRAVESRDDKRPTMADLRASGEIEEHADVIGLLYRPVYYIERTQEYRTGVQEYVDRYEAEKNRLDVTLGKNRLGPTLSVELWCDTAKNAVDNLRRY